MRNNHVIKTDQWRSAPQIHTAPHFVVSRLLQVMLRPLGQNFGLGLDKLASTSTSWDRPWPPAFGLDLTSELLTWPQKCAI